MKNIFKKLFAIEFAIKKSLVKKKNYEENKCPSKSMHKYLNQCRLKKYFFCNNYF